MEGVELGEDSEMLASGQIHPRGQARPTLVSTKCQQWPSATNELSQLEPPLALSTRDDIPPRSVLDLLRHLEAPLRPRQERPLLTELQRLSRMTSLGAKARKWCTEQAQLVVQSLAVLPHRRFGQLLGLQSFFRS